MTLLLTPLFNKDLVALIENGLSEQDVQIALSHEGIHESDIVEAWQQFSYEKNLEIAIETYMWSQN